VSAIALLAGWCAASGLGAAFNCALHGGLAHAADRVPGRPRLAANGSAAPGSSLGTRPGSASPSPGASRARRSIACAISTFPRRHQWQGLEEMASRRDVGVELARIARLVWPRDTAKNLAREIKVPTGTAREYLFRRWASWRQPRDAGALRAVLRRQAIEIDGTISRIDLMLGEDP
jgi:hypothetical protein